MKSIPSINHLWGVCAVLINMSGQVGVLNETAIAGEGSFYLEGPSSSSFDPCSSRQFCPKMAESSHKRMRDINVPSQPLCCLSGSTKRHHPVTMFCHGCFSAEQEPLCLLFRWARRGGVLVVFAFKMVPLLTKTGSPGGAGMESGENDCQPGERDIRYAGWVCVCVCKQEG